jgi:hypothetical protein
MQGFWIDFIERNIELANEIVDFSGNRTKKKCSSILMNHYSDRCFVVCWGGVFGGVSCVFCLNPLQSRFNS